MGTYIDLTDIQTEAQIYLDDIITELGKNCRLYYPPKPTECPNCNYNPVSGKSANTYKTGGPVPFTGICPYCQGKGKIFVESTYNLKFTVEEDPAKWFKNNNIQIPQGYIMTRGFLSDYPNIKKCQYMVVEPDTIGPYQNRRFVLWTEPADHFSIVQERYIICVWKRDG